MGGGYNLYSAEKFGRARAMLQAVQDITSEDILLLVLAGYHKFGDGPQFNKYMEVTISDLNLQPVIDQFD